MSPVRLAQAGRIGPAFAASVGTLYDRFFLPVSPGPLAPVTITTPPFDPHINFGYGTVLTPPSPASSGTSLMLASGQGALMPTPPFNAVAWPSGVQPLGSNAEIVRVTAMGGDTVTMMMRTQEGTPPQAIAAGYQFAAAITAKTLADVEGVVAGITTSVAANTYPAYIQPSNGSVKQALAGWYAAKAAAASAPAVIVHYGDSIVSGNNLTDGITNGWSNRLKQLLTAAGYANYGDGWSFAPYVQNPQQVPNTRFGTWLNANGKQLEAGLGRCIYDNTNTASLLLTINVPAGAIACDMICLAYAVSGTWQYKVDAGGLQTVTPVPTTGGTQQQNAVHYRVTIPLSGSNSTITIGNQTAGLVMVISALAFRFGTSGIGNFLQGQPGQSAADLTTSAGATTASAVAGVSTSPGVSAPDDKMLPWTHAATANNTCGAAWPLNPNLAIISYYANGMARGNNPNAERRGLDRLCRAIRAGNPNCSFMFLIPSVPDEIYQASTAENLQWVGERASRFKALIHDVSRSVGGVVVDIDQKWGEAATANGFLPANDVHPTGIGATSRDGHYDVAQTIFSVI